MSTNEKSINVTIMFNAFNVLSLYKYNFLNVFLFKQTKIAMQDPAEKCFYRFTSIVM